VEGGVGWWSKSDSKAFGRLICSRPKAKKSQKKSFHLTIAKSKFISFGTPWGDCVIGE
jgi:hypothetical protein